MGNSADDRLTERTVRRDEMLEELLTNARANGAEVEDLLAYQALLENMRPEELVTEHEKQLG